MKSNWKEITIELVSEQTGPVGVVIVSEVIQKLELDNKLISPANYAKFLIALSSALPNDINSLDICRKCRELVL